MGEIRADTQMKIEQVAQYLYANPLKKLREVAEHFQMTRNSLRLLMQRPQFTDYLAKMDALFLTNEVLPLKKKMELLAHESMDQIMERFEKNPEEVDTRLYLEIADRMTQRMGFGTAQHTKMQVNVTGNAVVVTKEELEAARDKMKALQRQQEDYAAIPHWPPGPVGRDGN